MSDSGSKGRKGGVISGKMHLKHHVPRTTPSSPHTPTPTPHTVAPRERYHTQPPPPPMSMRPGSLERVVGPPRVPSSSGKGMPKAAHTTTHSSSYHAPTVTAAPERAARHATRPDVRTSSSAYSPSSSHRYEQKAPYRDEWGVSDGSLSSPEAGAPVRVSLEEDERLARELQEKWAKKETETDSTLDEAARYNDDPSHTTGSAYHPAYAVAESGEVAAEAAATQPTPVESYGEWDKYWDYTAQAYYWMNRTTYESRWDEAYDESSATWASPGHSTDAVGSSSAGGAPATSDRSMVLEKVRMEMERSELVMKAEIQQLRARHAEEKLVLQKRHAEACQMLAERSRQERERLAEQLADREQRTVSREVERVRKEVESEARLLLSSADKRIVELQHSLEKATADHEALMTAAASGDGPQTKQIRILMGQLSEKESELTTIQKELALVERQLNDVQKQLEVSRQEHNESMNVQRATLLAMSTERSAEIQAACESRISGMQKDIEALNNKITEREREYLSEVEEFQKKLGIRFEEGRLQGHKEQEARSRARLEEERAAIKRRHGEATATLRDTHKLELEKLQAQHTLALQSERASRGSDSSLQVEDLKSQIRAIQSEADVAIKQAEAERQRRHAIQKQLRDMESSKPSGSTGASAEEIAAIKAEADATREAAVATAVRSMEARAEERVKSAVEQAWAESKAAHKAELEAAKIALGSDANDQVAKVKTKAEAALAEAQARAAADKENALQALRKDLDAQVKRAVQEAVTMERRKAKAEVESLQREKDSAVASWHRESALRRHLHNRVIELQGNIRVFARVRPVLRHEQERSASERAVAVDCVDEENVKIASGKTIDRFEFDRVFSPTSTQVEVFADVSPVVTSALDGYNVCIFAYGQTGSGKTHTMGGIPGDPGVNFRTLQELFRVRDARKDAKHQFKVSILEIYNENVRDLLTPSSKASKGKGSLDLGMTPEGQVRVKGLLEVPVETPDDVSKAMDIASKHRAVGSHDVNEHSSRSHLVLSVHCIVDRRDGTRTRSKLNLIDLAGSERVGKTSAKGARLKEAQHINKSLSALGDVIGALGSSSKHVPFRNSKLTFLLQDSLSGGSKVMMLVNASPVSWNAGETLCSFRFASRCRAVKLGQATRAEESKEVVMLKRQIDELRARLGTTGGGGGGGGGKRR